jgi:adenylosuccinate synthase
MQKQLIVALSGEICAGKTTLAQNLERRFGFWHFKTREILEHLSREQNPDRLSLQELGEKLDKQSKGVWIVHELQRHGYPSINNGFCIIDAVRIAEQLTALRRAYGSIVVHIHLVSSPDKLYRRYEFVHGNKRSKQQIREEYERVKSNETENNVDRLKAISDLVIDSERSGEEDVAIRAASFLELLSDHQTALVDVVIGGQFGSEGKGQICGYLAPEYDALVRTGGPNAGHTVFANPPHKFHLLPSGTSRAQDAKLIIGPGAVLNIDTLLEEISNYKVSTNRLVIDENATVISREDIRKESKLVAKIGSTGQGVGYATAHSITNRLDTNKNKARFFEKRLKGFLGSATDELEKIYRRKGKILLEGTQGTGLSLYHGKYPFVTSRDTTVSGCLSEAGIGPKRVRKIILVARTYPIRVESPVGGNSGPFGSIELNWRIIARRSNISERELRRSEKTTTTKRKRRVAEFSWLWFRKACELNSPTDLALTFVDHLNIANRKARRFEQLAAETISMIEELERCAGVPVSLISTRFEYRSIIDKRNWKGN